MISNYKVIYKNDLIFLGHIPLVTGGFSKHFYILYINKSIKDSPFHSGLNGFINIEDLKNSINSLNFLKNRFSYDAEYIENVNKWIEVYKSIEFNKINNLKK